MQCLIDGEKIGRRKNNVIFTIRGALQLRGKIKSGDGIKLPLKRIVFA